ncbi:class I SAM-dependent methyltransferase [Streptomyces ipomoeae]|uniref:class I SAM-dependent methyltransferase n=1 Tax=Streptomyces ipomoeae TaxID=103232 RepID=UPI0029AD3F5C|nr:class I SAM-dependent methyltransferase [Streptomyces ipomoeae]MDX2820483.1 class I SAM-dependent methyltransferase [Streptomyces ipomoeae]MDX2874807.1 class I SAM-dependent methyltransferase [Streptomyces ipomoeae]
MKIDSDVLKVIRSATVDGLTLRLNGTLDRKLYDRVNLALQAVGGTWNRYQRAHIFPFAAADAIAGLLATGEVITDVDRGYYPTPKPLVEQLLDLAELKVGCEVLEPSAGRGAIAEAAAARGAVVDCIELDTARAEYIRAGGYAREVTAADFFSVKVQRRYQRVIMNPPFADRQDIRHVQRALRFVQPGGLVVAVMYGSLPYRSDRKAKDFRARVREARGSITELPDDAFPIGVSTVVAVIPVREPAPPSQFNPQAPRPEDFTAKPATAQQGLFFTGAPTAHGTAPLDGFEYGAAPWLEIDPNTLA